jgi:di/tripeptidase
MFMSDRMIEQFMEMVRIPSESGNEADMIAYLQKEFTALGAFLRKDAKGRSRFCFPAMPTR